MDNKDSEVETTDREEDTPAPEDGGDDSDDITTQLTRVRSGAYTGQICTLKTLIDDDIVKTGNAVLSLEYMVSLKDIRVRIPRLKWVFSRNEFNRSYIVMSTTM